MMSFQRKGDTDFEEEKEIRGKPQKFLARTKDGQVHSSEYTVQINNIMYLDSDKVSNILAPHCTP